MKTPTDLLACAAYYEALSIDFKRQRAWESVKFYATVAFRYRELARSAREAA